MGTGGSYLSGKEAGDVKPTARLHLVPRLRMHGAIPPLPNTSSWHGALLNSEYIFIA